jgi:hypothetical protein
MEDRDFASPVCVGVKNIELFFIRYFVQPLAGTLRREYGYLRVLFE